MAQKDSKVERGYIKRNHLHVGCHGNLGSTNLACKVSLIMYKLEAAFSFKSSLLLDYFYLVQMAPMNKEGKGRMSATERQYSREGLHNGNRYQENKARNSEISRTCKAKLLRKLKVEDWV